ncbi:MAG: amidohydrolase family protein [Verrucomicrobia bacterium]|nr:amidohydrolase family protein [Verrucomicrobiota bacterium]
MNSRDFAFDPAYYGLPTREDLVAYRIWDSHFHGFNATATPMAQYRANNLYVERMGIERSITLEAGGTLRQPLAPAAHDAEMRLLLEQERNRLSGITPIDPGFPDESCAKMREWIERGPCIGIKYVGGNQRGIVCSHPNNDPIIRYAAELDATIYIHTWLKVGGTPRLPGRDNNPGESTPMDVVALARRFPQVTFICGHTGGDWELGVRVVRPQRNVLLEFAGSDPHSGAVDLAVRELGVDRIVWGGHGPSRSYATEIGKVLDADLSRADRMKIFGGNFRRLAAPIFRRKGWPIEI